jgi:hypothetical protein
MQSIKSLGITCCDRIPPAIKRCYKNDCQTYLKHLQSMMNRLKVNNTIFSRGMKLIFLIEGFFFKSMYRGVATHVTNNFF